MPYLNGGEISFTLSVSGRRKKEFCNFAVHICHLRESHFLQIGRFHLASFAELGKKSGDASWDLTRVDEVVPQLR